MKIIIQAGGKGTRLEQLTFNKPKALVSINNLPMIMHLFKLFKNDEFLIIGDYKFDVLKKYLETFATDYNYKIIKANNDGTTAGIKECLTYINNNEPFIISWCDLIMPTDFKLPNDLSQNYIGISKEYECRWSYIDNKFIKTPSKDNGVAGFFIFKNKAEISNISESGSFVGGFLANENINFARLDLFDSKEVGTMISYNANNNNKAVCRPFNKIEFLNEKPAKILKTYVNDYGKKIHEDEINWYKKVMDLNFKNIPTIYSLEPLIMEKINGKNIFEYNNADQKQKELILTKIIDILKNLHALDKEIDANINDLEENYINKTFDRINKVQDLIPFAHREEIVINGKKCKNIFFIKEEIQEKIKKHFSKKFALIHGDCTFSNIMWNEDKNEPVLIDPRGYFGKTKYYGDEYYDWAKLYYSLVGNYDQFNNKNFVLKIHQDNVELNIDSNNWENLENKFFELLPNIDREKIKLIHAIIWISLTTYAWDNYDSVCGAFYNGLLKLNEVL